MTHSDLEPTRSALALRRAVPPLLIGGALCLLILFVGQWPQACNGVQVCPPLSLRASTAAVWTLIVALAALIASVVEVALPGWTGRLAMGVLITVGIAGALLTVFVTGF